MDEIAQGFLSKYEVPGRSVAITRHGQFVYRKAFAWTDPDKGERAKPTNLFRIAPG